MDVKHKTYEVKYKNGQTATLTGRIFLFSSKTTTEVLKYSGGIYLNSEEVVYVIEKSKSDD